MAIQRSWQPFRQIRRVVSCALAAFCSALAAAQEIPTSTQAAAASQPALETQPVAPSTMLTAPALQMLLKQAQEATDLSEEAKSKAVGFYRQAIEQIEVASQYAAKAAEFEADRQNAPETLKAIQAELATPLGEPTPDVPSDATRADLEQRLRQAQSDLDAEKKSLADWEHERDRRTARRREIPELLSAARTRLQGVIQLPPPAEGEPPAVRLAHHALTQARRLAIEREIDAYSGALASDDARRDLLQARLDRATRRAAHLEKLVAAWQGVVQRRAQQESEQALREAREQLKDAHSAIRPLAEERERWALRTRELQAETKKVEARTAEVDAHQSQLSQDFDRITRRVNATGLTNAIGQLLRKQRGDLPSLRPLERDLRQRKDKISSVQLEMMEVEDRRAELVDAGALVAGIMERLDRTTAPDEREVIRQAAEEAVLGLRADLDSLLKELDRYFDRLVDLDDKERALRGTITRFGDYADEKILWIKSSTLPNRADVRHGQAAVEWLVAPAGWRAVFASISGTLRANPATTVVGLVLVLTPWLLSRRLVSFVRTAGELVGKPARDSMRHTIGVLLATVALAARWPLTLVYLGWLVATPYNATDFLKSVSSGLYATALILFTLQALRQLARRDGLAEKHFRWNARALAALRRHLAWLTFVLVPTFFVFSSLEAQPLEAAKDSLGRLAFVIAFLAITLFAQRVLHPGGPVLGPTLQRHRDGGWYRLRHLWYLAALAIPASLVVAAVLGYYYTAMYLSASFVETAWLVLSLIVLRALVERWLLLQIRRRAIAEARERAALRRQQLEAEASTASEPDVIAIPEEKLDVVAINKQTLQLVRMFLLVGGVVALAGIWADALPALGVFRGVTLWTITERGSESVPTADGGTQLREVTRAVPITLASGGLALLVALVTIIAVKNIPGLLEITLLQRLPLDAGGRFAVTAVTRYALTVTGVIATFAQIGIGWSQVQWLVAAMTVGLGFGLQEIFANLVSGIMLLFERPVRIGDTVTVGQTSGTVTRIRTRATTIMGWDRKELIIPNKEFITGHVVNWTLSDSTLRIILPVGIAYGSDTQLARDTLLRVAREHPQVLDDPSSRVLFMGFGDSALSFELRVFIGSLDYYLSTIDELNQAIDTEFRAAGIEIAFPQRDIHVRSFPAELPQPHNAANPPSERPR